jgi:uncharacterized paraquat-inducible protein A
MPDDFVPTTDNQKSNSVATWIYVVIIGVPIILIIGIAYLCLRKNRETLQRDLSTYET